MHTHCPTAGKAGPDGPERPEAALFVHLRWRTANGAPLLRDPDIRQAVRTAVTARAGEMRCRTLAFDGSDDRVQAVFRFPASVSVSVLTQEVLRVSDSAAARLLWREYGRPMVPGTLWTEPHPQTLGQGDLDTALDAVRREAAAGPEARTGPEAAARDGLAHEPARTRAAD